MVSIKESVFVFNDQRTTEKIVSNNYQVPFYSLELETKVYMSHTNMDNDQNNWDWPTDHYLQLTLTKV